MRLLALLIFSTNLFASEVLIDRTVATVQDEVIALSDLNKYRETFKLRRGSMSEEEFDATMKSNEKLLNRLIDEKIISQYVAEKDLKCTEEEVNEIANRPLKMYNMTPAQLKMQLEHEGITYTTYMAEKKKECELSKVLESEIKRTTNVTEDDLKRSFESKTNEKVNITEYRIQVIVSAKEETVKKAYDAIKSGSDFNDMVREYSEDKDTNENNGDLGFLNPGGLIPELRDPIMGMSIGDVKGPIKTKFGYYLIKLAEVKNSENPHYTSSKDELRRELMGNEINKQLTLWLERKRSESYVKINL